MPLQRSARLSALPRVEYYKKISPAKLKDLDKKRTVKTATKQRKIRATTAPHIKMDAASDVVPEMSNINIPLSSKTELTRPYDFDKALSHLKSVDKKLAKMITEESVAKFKEKLLKADGANPFRALATSIIYQQIHGKAAESIKTKFVNSFDPPADASWFPTPAMVLKKSVDELRSVGLSGRKVEYIQCLAKKFNDKEIIPENLNDMSDEDISELLCSVKGIGPWTVDMFLMFNLRHPDVLPVSDLGIRKGMALHFGSKSKKGELPPPAMMREWAEVWRPYRSLACWYMWSALEIKVVND